MPTQLGKASKGSQKWVQVLVNDCESLLKEELSTLLPDSPSDIDWRSPLAENDYKEHRDREFLEKLGSSWFLEKPLPSWPDLYKFWPRNGPSWDVHGVTDRRQILLVEAKSHIKEMRSSGSGATSQKSIEKIAPSLGETQRFLGVDQSVDWAKSPYFQYANRLAHLYWFREHNGLPAFLIMLHFLNDREREGPSNATEWEPAITAEQQSLGIPLGHKLSDFIVHMFIDVYRIMERE